MKITYFYTLLMALLFFQSCSVCDDIPNITYCSTAPQINSYPFTAVIYGDTRGKHDLEVWRSSSDKIRLLIPTAIAQSQPAFIIHTGDFVLSSSSQSDWTEFDINHAEILKRNIPFFPVLGNHEYWGKDKKALANYFDRFPDLFAQHWYSFEVLGIVFIILDTNYDELAGYQIRAQERWLEFQLSKAQNNPNIKQVILATHHPIYSNGKTHGDSEWLHTTVLPLLHKFSKAQLIFCAHIHNYEHFFEKHTHFVVTGGGGAPLFDVYEGKKRRHVDLYTGTLRNYHYCQLTFTATQVEIKINMLNPKTNQWFIADQFIVAYNNF